MVAAVAGRPPGGAGIKTAARRRQGLSWRQRADWAAAMEKGYNCPLWCTYKQAAELGGQVRKGEKGSLVVYADTFTKKDTDDKGANIDTS
jgi:antirestriction protein ArdC